MKKKKRRFLSREVVFVVLSIVIMITIVSRGIPDGRARLDLGKSNVGEKAIALTFDGCAGAYTKKLIDGLARTGAKVTLFVHGKDVEKNPQIVLRAHDEGHLIGNYTYDDKSLLFMSSSAAKADINKSADIIGEEIGYRPFFVRVPGSAVTSYQLNALNCFFVAWSENIYDKGNYTGDEIYKKIIRNARDGEIIRLNINSESTVEGILKAIPELQAEGYEFVRVDDLLTRNGNKLAKGMLYRKCKYDASPIAF